MAKKILFIYPDFLEKTKNIRTFPGNYNEGLASLSACLKQAGHQTVLYHQTFMPTREEFTAHIKQHAPDIIAFTIRTTIMELVTEMLGWLDDDMPEIPVMCGGYHPTLAPEATLMTRGIDMICIGEGELACVDLINSYDSTGEFDLNTASFWFKLPDGNIKKNPIRPYVQDLDQIPFPDLDLYDFKSLSASIRNTAEAIVSRGCLYSCTYCSNANMRNVYEDKKNYARFRSPENAIQLLETIIERVPHIKQIDFNDAILNMYDEWFIPFMELYRARIGRKFTCNLRFDHLDEEMCKLLAESGCYKITIGLENGNDEYRRKYLKRSMKNDHMIKISHLLKKYKISVVTYNLLGLPYETLDLSLETIKLNSKLHSDNVIVSIFYPYPGTELRNISERGGFVRENILPTDKVPLSLPDYPPHEVLFARYSFMKLIKRYRKIYEKYDEQTAQKKTDKLDRRLTSKFYPHALVYRQRRYSHKMNIWTRTKVKRFFPGLYNYARDRKYKM